MPNQISTFYLRAGIESGDQLALNNMSIFLNFKKRKKIRWKIFIYRYYPYLIGLFFCLVIFSLLSPYIFRPWTSYPEELKAEIAWRKFRATFNNTCRESCLVARQSYASIWRPVYRQKPALGENNFASVFSQNNEELQAAVIKIMAADYGSLNLPPILAQVLMADDTSLENKRLIVTFFSESFNNPDWWATLRAQVLDETLNLNDRLYALKLLAPFPDPENIILVKQLLLKPLNQDFLETTFHLVSAWPPGALSWSELELDQLAHLIKQLEPGPARWRRLWLLAEEGIGDSLSRPERLKELANNQFLDNISRGLVAETLLNEFKIEINTPEPSASEWQAFYESI